MATSNIYDRAGKIARTVTLTSAQTDQARTLCDAVRDAQNIMKNKPELDIDGHALKGTTSASGAPNSASAPDDVFSVLARLDELVGGDDSRMPLTYPHLNGSPATQRDDSFRPIWPNTVLKAPTHAGLRAIRPDGNYRQAAYDLGLILSATTSTEFERAEVVDSPAPGSGVPQQRAWLRWR